MIYIGYPVEIDEALRISSQPNIDALQDLLEKNGLELLYTDKGQFIIGRQCEGGSAWKLQNTDDFISTVQQKKQKVKQRVISANLDLTDVNLYPIEQEYQQERFPEPKIVIWFD